MLNQERTIIFINGSVITIDAKGFTIMTAHKIKTTIGWVIKTGDRFRYAGHEDWPGNELK